MSNSKQALWILFGSLSAFVFSTISSIVLSRYFTKVDYGTYKQILYVYGAFLVVFSLGLPKTYSFFLPRLPIEEAREAIKKINYILVVSGICMSVAIFFSADWVGVVLKNERLSEPLRYFSLVSTFLLPTIGLDGILATYGQTKLLALYNILTKLVMLICVVVPVIFFNGGVSSAVIGFTLASLIAFLLANLLKYYPLKKVESKATTLNYKEIFDYALPLLCAGLWGVLINLTDQFFISRYFGTETFADFSNGALELPFVGMVIAATSVILAPIYSKKAFDGSVSAKQEITKLWNSVFSKTIMLTYPLIAFFFCFADIIMVSLYGQEYLKSGDYFQIKLLVNFFTLIAYGPLILSIGGNKYYYRVHMYGAVILIALQALSVYLIHSAIAIVWVSVICQIGRIIAMLIFVAKYFELKLYKIFPWTTIAKLLVCFVILYIIKNTVFLYFLFYNAIFALSISGVIYMVIFFIWSYICKLNYFSVIKPLLKGRLTS